MPRRKKEEVNQDTKPPADDQTKSAVTPWENWDGPTGYENVGQDDLGLPFLTIVQKGSPEVDEDHPDHEQKKIEGVRAGSVIHSISREHLYHPKEDEPLRVIPCSYYKAFVEWRPRGQGGGYVQTHTDPNILQHVKRNEKNLDILPNGNELATTAYFFCLVEKEEGEWEEVLIGMTSTQLKYARQWLNLAKSNKIRTRKGIVTPPLYSTVYRVSTFSEKNEKGTWHSWLIQKEGMLGNDDMELIDRATEVSKQASLPQVRQIAPPQSEERQLPAYRDEDDEDAAF